MSVSGTVIAFLAAAFMPKSDEEISSPIAPAPAPTPIVELPPVDPPPIPRSRQEAQTMLIDQLIIALRDRPQDFRETTHTLNDSATGMEWWIANGAQFFRLQSVRDCGCSNLQATSPDQIRAWAAFEAWRDTPIGVADAPEVHEAMRLWEANQKANR